MLWSPEATAIRLGGRYEQAIYYRRYAAAARIEREVMQLAADNVWLWIDPFIVRGRNAVRRVLKLEKVEL